LGSDGRPFRWQIRSDGKNTIHIKNGYSDHLLLKIDLKLTKFKERSFKKQNIPNIPTGPEITPPEFLPLDTIDICKKSDTIDFNTIADKNLNAYVGQCISIQADEKTPGFKLIAKGRFRTNFIKLQSTKHKDSTTALRITMTRNFDWRPNIDDSRVSKEEALIKEGKYNPKHPHPKSSLCFDRFVLQGVGGELRFVSGRLGYRDGALALFVLSSERKFIELENLPEGKATACKGD
jgi:hypothetical protein